MARCPTQGRYAALVPAVVQPGQDRSGSRRTGRGQRSGMFRAAHPDRVCSADEATSLPLRNIYLLPAVCCRSNSRKRAAANGFRINATTGKLEGGAATAELMTTGTSASAGSLASARTNSSPLIPGIMLSVTISAGRSARAQRNAWQPSKAFCTTYPSSSARAASASSSRRSSSTRSTVANFDPWHFGTNRVSRVPGHLWNISVVNTMVLRTRRECFQAKPAFGRLSYTARSIIRRTNLLADPTSEP
ncbi:hypothetical protein SAMN05421548_14440 [Paraburkholderia lycopersici]|uniref:Uncharacterized protein n=1 Tax=Paraburkholderia lycopersici TaxID=416944 RepID=A0A1G7CDR0_9BURK|nr:hypothetical protein SAMN05421548_14440 [Paraburkholderia lycopersici]